MVRVVLVDDERFGDQVIEVVLAQREALAEMTGFDQPPEQLDGVEFRAVGRQIAGGDVSPAEAFGLMERDVVEDQDRAPVGIDLLAGDRERLGTVGCRRC